VGFAFIIVGILKIINTLSIKAMGDKMRRISGYDE
jgi:hypothetical protein